MPVKKIRAAAYTRVSTREQASRGLSLAEQVERIRAFAEQQGWQVAVEFEDAGKSGSKSYRTRPAFQRMISGAVNGDFEVLIVVDESRFGRNLKDFLNVEAELADAGVTLLALDDPGYDVMNEGHVLGRQVKGAVAQFVARQSRAKSIRVREAKLNRGEYRLGQRIPYGLRWKDKKGTSLEHDPHDIRVWGLMKKLRSAGWGYGRIADVLNGREPVSDELLGQFGVMLPVPNRYGMKIWREGAIASMFRDEQRVTGILTINFKRLNGEVKVYEVSFPPLMTRAEFKRFSELSKKKLTWSPRNVGKGSVLSGLCRCSLCGATLHVAQAKGHAYYGCSARLRARKGDANRCTLPLISGKKLERVVFQDIADFLQDDEGFNAALAAANVAERDRGAELAKVEKQIKQVEQEAKTCQSKLDRLVAAIAEGTIKATDAKTTRKRIADEEAATEKRLADLAGQQAALHRLQGKAAQVDASREKIRRRLGRLPDLLGLSKMEKQDLLRSLLPADSDSCIVIHTLTAEEAEELGREWDIEIRGLLPIESTGLRYAVLGGALAVP